MNAATWPIEALRAAFLHACTLDVAVRKPGNVSLQSPGHGMQAALFIHSAQAAAGPLLAPGARVGARIEAAQAASWQVAGCNTNLGILLLCAPLAVAAERFPQPPTWPDLRQAVESVLIDLDLADAHAAYRAIAAANPGGLGEAAVQDVHDSPSVGLRDAMILAADRDSIARQYRDGFADLLAVAKTVADSGGLPGLPAELQAEPERRTVQTVQRLYLTILARWPDSHIVRKHGDAMAHTVMRSAQAWRVRASAGEALDADPSFAAWDARLKSEGLNPGTTADLTVAALMLAGLMAPAAQPVRDPGSG
ncbi:triphosphoribosyl-dephospho-CoA synthase [Aquabacterium sp.]|uniref:triphosphoribosyl-dephospho-CoA synthase n=1 Tax=Aquabacterium sp. TaxID=1872578 RepID=UPI002B6AFDB2|nr:triphosphoribosyl-dephospho-CoA synthase [Aquabacterium sp.]HSW08751.1 triphosphoribosyl-dephospho-CoA synthase [Aquabacterium sp.]